MEKYFTFDTINDKESVEKMCKFFDNLSPTLIADSNLLGTLIIACSYRNVKHAELITECLKLLGYRIRRFFDGDTIDITLIIDNCYMRIYNNEVVTW